MVSHRTENENADLLGGALVGGATEAASFIMEQLGKDNIRFVDRSSAPQFVSEVVVFYMHLVDRSAFAHLGATKRKIFMDRFVLAVVREVLRELSKEISADDFGEALRDTYNRRQTQYAEYKTLMPEKDEPPKGTLYWEFSKILFGFLDDTNPVTLMLLNLLVADLTEAILNDALKLEEVLRSESLS